MRILDKHLKESLRNLFATWNRTDVVFEELSGAVKDVLIDLGLEWDNAKDEYQLDIRESEKTSEYERGRKDERAAIVDYFNRTETRSSSAGMRRM